MNENDARVVEMLRQELDIPHDVEDAEIAEALGDSFTFAAARVRLSCKDIMAKLRDAFRRT